jgi:transaldolase
MAIYLDSAIPGEARRAFALGFVRGITTNPSLLREVGGAPGDVIRKLCHICPGTVFYQLAASTVAERAAEADRILDLNHRLQCEASGAPHRGSSQDPAAPIPTPGRVGLKIPATTENMALVHEFASQGVIVAVTAIFSLAQAYAACEAGATYVLPYVNRFTRLCGDGIGFVKDLAHVCRCVEQGTEVLAASIKSPLEAVQALLSGAHHVSMPLPILLALGHHPLSVEAVAEFGRTESPTA